MDNLAIRQARLFLAVSIIVALLSFVSAQTCFAQTGLVKLADNVYSYVDAKPMLPGNSFAANAGVIIGEDGIAVVDTLMSAREGQRLLSDIRAISGKPIKYVILTHYHFDHVLGCSIFNEQGATVISHALDKNNLAKAGPTMVSDVSKAWGLTDDVMADTTVVYPRLTFTDKMTIDLGGQTIELIYPGPAHTSGSILVYLPDSKILFSGDIMFTGFHPFIADGNIPGWLNALECIDKLAVDQIIPGHGPVSTKKDANDMKSYLIIFDKTAKELCAKSQDIEYIFSEMKKVLPQRDCELMIKGNIRQKYLKQR